MNTFVNANPSNDDAQQFVLAEKFSLRHSFRAGAIVWIKDKLTNKDYYTVFKSFSRPTRGIQLPGGRVEKMENIADTVVREVKEETGLDTRILCPLGFIYLNNPSKNYSRVEIYYIVRPLGPIDVRKKWRHIDRDKSAQNLECWFVPTDRTPQFLATGQDLAVNMFKQWLKEHARNKINFGEAYLNNYGEDGTPIKPFYTPYSASQTIGNNGGQSNNNRPNSYGNPNQGNKRSNFYNNLDKQINQVLDYRKAGTNPNSNNSSSLYKGNGSYNNAGNNNFRRRPPNPSQSPNI